MLFSEKNHVHDRASSCGNEYPTDRHLVGGDQVPKPTREQVHISRPPFPLRCQWLGPRVACVSQLCLDVAVRAPGIASALRIDHQQPRRQPLPGLGEAPGWARPQVAGGAQTLTHAGTAARQGVALGSNARACRSAPPPIASRLEAAGGLAEGRQRRCDLTHSRLLLLVIKSFTGL